MTRYPYVILIDNLAVFVYLFSWSLYLTRKQPSTYLFRINTIFYIAQIIIAFFALFAQRFPQCIFIFSIFVFLVYIAALITFFAVTIRAFLALRAELEREKEERNRIEVEMEVTSRDRHNSPPYSCTYEGSTEYPTTVPTRDSAVSSVRNPLY